jgi:hypothetical protein
VATIAWIMVGCSLVLLGISIFDRTLGRTAVPPPDLPDRNP